MKLFSWQKRVARIIKPMSKKEKRKMDDAHFDALCQMIENVKDDPEGRSELVNKLF